MIDYDEYERDELAAQVRFERRTSWRRALDPRDPEYYGDPPEYAIGCKTTPSLRWSNANGWTKGPGYDRFTETETETLNLPIEGEWVKL